jgi:TPR repeat protein
VEVKSPAFSVVSDGSQKDALRTARQFEQVRALLKESWPWARLDPSRPVTILAVRDEAGLRALLPAFWEKKGGTRPAGICVRAPDRNWVALRMDVARFRESDRTWDNPYLVVFHEYVHLVLHLNFGALPLWLDEGLAEFWGNTVVEEDRLYQGLYVPYHLVTLRARLLLPLVALFAVKHGSPEYSESDRATVFYAESWALVHYLAMSDVRRGQLNRFVALLKNGRGADEAARETFGNLAALERELRAYVRRRDFPYRRRTVSLPVGQETWRVRALPAAESLALRASLHVAMGRAAEARAMTAQALTLDPQSAPAHEALGLLALREGRRDEALEALRRAVAVPEASDYAHYLYGQLLWEGRSGADDLDKIETHFRRAVDMNSSFADAYDALARVMAERGVPLERTLPLAVRAAELEPGEVGHSLTALRLAVQAGAVEEARARAERLLSRAEGEDRSRVEALLKDLAAPRQLPPEAACNAGVASACAEVGGRLRDGLGTPRDLAKAALYFEKACAAGHAGSCAAFGWALEQGGGVTKDLPRAVSLFRQACEGGEQWSCTRLAFALASGQGVAANPAEAARLFDAACRAGDVQSCASFGSMLRLGHGVARDENRAETLLADACERDLAWACGELGFLLAARSTQASLRRAATLFDRACGTGLAGSCAMLAALTEIGQGVPRDLARARELYRRACEGGYSEACAKAGTTK